MAHEHGHVDGKPVPELRVDQPPVLRQERLHFRDVATSARLEQRPGIIAVQLLDATDIGLRLHLLRLRHRRRGSPGRAGRIGLSF